MSYSKAWRMIDEIERGLGIALLERHAGGPTGGGSRLTEAADSCWSASKPSRGTPTTCSRTCFTSISTISRSLRAGDGDGDSRVDLQPARERGGSLHEGGSSSG